MRPLLIALIVLVLAAPLAADLQAATPTSINVQGRLTDSSGAPLAAGLKGLTFRIYDAATVGTEIWPGGAGEVHLLTTGNDGLWNALIGSFNPLTDSVFADTVRWLEVTVNDGVNPITTLPRVRLVTGPYAHRVSTVDGASGGTITSPVAIGQGLTLGAASIVSGVSNTATVGSGQSAIIGGSRNSMNGRSSMIAGGSTNAVTSDNAFVAGSGNTVSADYSTIAGGQDNQISNVNSFIGSGFKNTVSGASAAVGGGIGNTAGGLESVIGGGVNNVASNQGATIGGGGHNRARGLHSVIAGGGGTQPGDSNLAKGDYSTVGGGKGNFASGLAACVGGGSFNRARGDYAVVAGGGGATLTDSNSANGWAATVGGGLNNHASNVGTTVAGGGGNIASGLIATIGGGTGNLADAEKSTVAGGAANTASGLGATVGGGLNNFADDFAATVPGGLNNRASGMNSFAVGSSAKAIHNATLVFAATVTVNDLDSVYSSASQQIVMRADGGYYLTNDSGKANIPFGVFLNTSTGAHLTDGGVWTNSSDADRKENFVPADPADILRKIASLPITEWNYKNEDDAVRHIGPTAQDFRKLFGLGSNDKTISTIDPAGVALVAIKELDHRTRRIAELETELQELRTMVLELQRQQ